MVANGKGQAAVVSSDTIDNRPSSPNIGGAATPPEVAARFAIMIEEGILPSTTLEQRRRNQRTGGTQYGAPQV